MAGFTFSPTYQDYLNSHAGQQGGGSEGGQGSFSGLTPEQFAAMSNADRWNNIGNAAFLDPSDPRYSALAQQLGVTAKQGPDSIVGVGRGAVDPRNFVDPKQVVAGDGMYAFSHPNLTPLAEQQAGGMSNKFWAFAPAMVVGAGLAAGAMGVGAGGTAGSSALTTGGFGTDIAAGSGTFGGTAADVGLGSAGVGAEGGANPSYWNQLASNAGQTDVPIGEEGYGGLEGGSGTGGLQFGGGETGGGGFSLGESGGLDPETLGGAGGMGNVASGGSYAGPATGGSTSLLGQAGNYLMDHPMQAARAGMGLYALGAGAHSGSSSNTSGGGSMTDPTSIINAMAQANRVNQVTPFGSRTWTQDPTTGQWTATDAMSPTEQANYQNVAGMNTDVTNYARQRLAQLMAAPPSQRADRPISFRLHGG